MSEPMPEAVPGEDLVIHAPVAAADAAAPPIGNSEPEETGDGVD